MSNSFIFVGNGAEKENLLKQSSGLALNNVTFKDKAFNVFLHTNNTCTVR